MFFLKPLLVCGLTAMAHPPADPCIEKQNLQNRMNVISSNIANINSTRTPEGGAYKYKKLECVDQKCQLLESSETMKRYEPEHPDAKADGIVEYPKIDLMKEMEAMVSATKSYDAADAACTTMLSSSPR